MKPWLNIGSSLSILGSADHISLLLLPLVLRLRLDELRELRLPPRLLRPLLEPRPLLLDRLRDPLDFERLLLLLP